MAYLDTVERRSRLALPTIASDDAVNQESQPAEKYSNATDLMTFLPWAAAMLGLQVELEMIRNIQAPITPKYLSESKYQKSEAFQKSFVSESQLSAVNKGLERTEEEQDAIIHIILTYNIFNTLTYLKIDKSKSIPRKLIRIISLVIHLYPNLYGFAINRGADQYTIYELSRLIPLSHITEICLDDVFVPQANFHVLLEQPNNLSVLSLSRCKMGDAAFELICRNLEFPKPASQTIFSLSVSSNRLSDDSAKALAKALRSNRKLYYVNLADNYITDDGAKAIFSSLKPFQLTEEENIIMGKRYKDLMAFKLAKILENSRRGSTPVLPGKRITTKRPSFSKRQSLSKRRETIFNTDNTTHDPKADAIAMKRGINFEKQNSFLMDCYKKGGKFHSKGNRALAYLNLAYNNLSYLSLRCLSKLLNSQKLSEQKPAGLVNINIEGNPIPSSCEENDEINAYFNTTLPDLASASRRRSRVPSMQQNFGKGKGHAGPDRFDDIS